MPKGRPRSKFPEDYAGEQTAAPAPRQAGAEINTPVRPQIKQMTGHMSEEEMAESLPTNTMLVEEDRPKRTRRAKPQEPAIDPLMADKRYAEAVSNMRGLGAPRVVKGAFNIIGTALENDKFPLNSDEEREVDDYFYVMGKKYSILDPSSSPVWMALYFLGMIITFGLSRFVDFKSDEIKDQIGRWFGKPEKQEEKKDEEEED